MEGKKITTIILSGSVGIVAGSVGSYVTKSIMKDSEAQDIKDFLKETTKEIRYVLTDNNTFNNNVTNIDGIEVRYNEGDTQGKIIVYATANTSKKEYELNFTFTGEGKDCQNINDLASTVTGQYNVAIDAVKNDKAKAEDYADNLNGSLQKYMTAVKDFVTEYDDTCVVEKTEQSISMNYEAEDNDPFKFMRAYQDALHEEYNKQDKLDVYVDAVKTHNEIIKVCKDNNIDPLTEMSYQHKVGDSKVDVKCTIGGLSLPVTVSIPDSVFSDCDITNVQECANEAFVYVSNMLDNMKFEESSYDVGPMVINHNSIWELTDTILHSKVIEQESSVEEEESAELGI